MEQINLFEGIEFWKILICFLGAFSAAFYFYFRSSDYDKRQQWGLGTLRFVSVFILLFLLLGPKIRQVTNIYSASIITLLVDDSESIAATKNQQKVIERVKSDFNKYQKLGYKVHLRGLSGIYSHPDSIRFTAQQTNLNKTLKALDDFYYGLDLNKIILYSDGIETSGSSVLSSKYNFALDAVGVGDTTERMDVKVLRVERNENVYKGNTFLARGVIESVGVPLGTELQVSFYKGDKKLKDTLVTSQSKKMEVTFKDTPSKKGIYRYKMSIKPLNGEVSERNNSKEFFIEVLEGQDKILLVYNAPHPDVKMLREIFKGRKNFLLDVKSVKATKDILVQDYQLVVFHALPTYTNQINKLITQAKLKKVPAVYFVTNSTYLPLFNASCNVLVIERKGDINYVDGYVNEEFNYFDVPQGFNQILSDFPPIATPYADYKMKTGSQLLLGQRVGKVNTEFPLLSMKYGENKEGVFVGDGLWKWRLEALMNNKNIKSFDDYFFNYFQLLANNRSFDRLKGFPSQTEFTTNQKVSFKGFTYNELYEEIYGQQINLTVTNEKGETQRFSFLSSQNHSGFVLPHQEEGVYSYSCESVLNNEKFVTYGKYVINKLKLEQLNLQADFDCLRSLAIRQQGRFSQIEETPKTENKAAQIIHSSFEEKELIELKWLFYLLCIVLSIEWFFRKYWGNI